jgi:hypothetical protein
LVRRDKEASNLAKLTESGNSPAVLWEIANAAVGKPRQPLPTSVTRADGTHTEGNLEAANAVNAYFVQKVLRICTGRGVQNTSQKTATTSRDGDRRGKNTFAFGFASAGQIAKIFSYFSPRHGWDPGVRPQDGVRHVGRVGDIFVCRGKKYMLKKCFAFFVNK